MVPGNILNQGKRHNLLYKFYKRNISVNYFYPIQSRMFAKIGFIHEKYKWKITNNLQSSPVISYSCYPPLYSFRSVKVWGWSPLLGPTTFNRSHHNFSFSNTPAPQLSSANHTWAISLNIDLFFQIFNNVSC